VCPTGESEDDDDEHGNPHGYGAEIVGPFGEIQSEKIENGEAGEEKYREADEVDGLSREMLQRGVQEQHVAGCEVQHGREIGKVAGPIHPGGEEACTFAEGFFDPDIETTFSGKAGRKGDDGNSERNVEKKPGTEPDDEGRRTVTGGGGDPAETYAGDDVEKEKIAEAHDAGRSGGGDWG